MTKEISSFFQQYHNLNKKKLIKFHGDVQSCEILLMEIKIRLATLKMQMAAQSIIYKDLMKLRKILLPYLEQNHDKQ